jgi:RNA polymerase sigma factor (sigma-70 family)
MAAVPSTGRADAAPHVSPVESEATRDLYERYGRQVYRYCLSALGSPEEADDAVQSTFLNVFRGLRRGVVPEQEAAWLFRIARNVCLTRQRSSRRRGRVEAPVDFALVEEIAPSPQRASDELFGVREALETMPETQRRAILLREWQGLSYREIAEKLGTTPSAVETLIFRARRGLASRLERPAEAGVRSRRLRAGGDLGGLLTTLKTALAGGAAAKVAGAAAVVAVSTVAVTVSDHGPRPHRHVPPVPPTRHVVSKVTPAPRSTAVVSPPRIETPRGVGRQHPGAKPAKHAPRGHGKPKVALHRARGARVPVLVERPGRRPDARRGARGGTAHRGNRGGDPRARGRSGERGRPARSQLSHPEQRVGSAGRAEPGGDSAHGRGRAKPKV